VAGAARANAAINPVPTARTRRFIGASFGWEAQPADRPTVDRSRTSDAVDDTLRTLLAGWAYGAIYGSSHERRHALDGWLWTYNHRRPHGALSHKPPIARLNELNNLAGSYS
jgi:transposase InsO family protein